MEAAARGLNSPPRWFIAVHAGAGYHSPEYKRAIEESLAAAQLSIDGGASVTAVVQASIEALEDNPIVNAGYGANLTEQGEVECDASIMDGKTGAYGAIGAVSGVSHPIAVAHDLASQQQAGLRSGGRIPPMFLVGPAARSYAQSRGISVVPPESLVSPRARESYLKYKQLLSVTPPATQQHSQRQDAHFDTVGAVCVLDGQLAAGVSSGGISMKMPGRVSEAAMYGAGCWAAERIAVSTSGEQVAYSLLASEAARASLCAESLDETLVALLQRQFIKRSVAHSSLPPLYDFPRYAGLIALRLDAAHELELFWGHTSPSFAIGHLSSARKAAKVTISRMAEESWGNDVAFGGTYLRMADSS